MLLNRGVIVICRTGRDERRGIDTRFFDARRLNESLELRRFVVRSKEEPDVHLVVISADTTEEGDAALRTQFLNQTSSVNAPSHERAGKKQTSGRPQFFFNHSCSHGISASGRRVGSFCKYCLRKSSRRGEARPCCFDAYAMCWRPSSWLKILSHPTTSSNSSFRFDAAFALRSVRVLRFKQDVCGSSIVWKMRHPLLEAVLRDTEEVL